MKWFDKLERKYGKYAINNLMYYIIGLYVVGFVINLAAPQFYAAYLDLSIEKVLQGQVWRLITYIIEPPSTSILFAALTLYLYYIIGKSLEQAWGAFKFNLYYFSGVVLHIIAAFLIYFIFGVDFSMTTYYINLALFMAFAMEYGETVVYVFFVIPVKIKWLAYLDGVIFALTIVGGFTMPFLFNAMPELYIGLYKAGIMSHPVYATCALLSMINFIVFLFISRKKPHRSKTQKQYKKAYETAAKAEKKCMQNKTEQNRGGYVGFGARHKCAVCGRTELDGEDMVFRYCSKCEGDREYCQDHLYTHIHVKNDD